MPEGGPKFSPEIAHDKKSETDKSEAVSDEELETAEILPDDYAEAPEARPKSAAEKEAIIRKFFAENKSGREDKGRDAARGGGVSGMTDETKENLLGE